MTLRTWTIRDQKPDGSWGPEREVTLEQYCAECEAAVALESFLRNLATSGDRDTRATSTTRA